MRATLALALVLVPLGCGNADATRSGARVLARVNGAEIAATEAPAVQALERVIERELLVQQALAAGLDRDPSVREKLDDARRQVLAQAWLERRIAAPRPTREEVRAFYAENPALFAERRIYRMRELQAAPPELLEAVRAEIAGGAGLDELAAWLRLRKARFVVEQKTLPAEQVPLAHLAQLARLAPGGLAVLPVPAGVAVVELQHAEPAPLSEAQAAPLIEQFLAGRRRLELAEAEVKRLRAAAAIEYAGDFQARAR